MKLQGKSSGVRLVSLAITIMAAVSIFASVAQANTFVVTNTGNSGPGSLMQAILDANANPGADVITFNIPGSGVHTIAPPSSLPNMTDPVTIDGYTQPGAKANSLALGSNAVLLIELSGASGNVDAGLTISAGSSTIRGLVINRFKFQGVNIQTKGGNIIAGNYIGSDATGTSLFPIPNNGSGVFVTSNVNTIGGLLPADRNVISGNGNANGGTGVYMSTPTAQGNKVIGNYIGTDASGMKVLYNFNNGIVIGGGSDNVIGGTTAAERNVITANPYGITLNADQNLIRGNYIGTWADGSAGYGNGTGVNIYNGSNNTVGGTTPGSGNLIAWNKSEGVFIESASTNNAILGNSIHDNTGFPGIDLYSGALGVTPNDNNTGDADSGPNNLQNFPILTSVTSSGGTTIVKGTLDSAFGKQFRVELFSNQACDPSGFGEGETYLGFTSVTTDASGKGSFTISVPAANVAGGFFSATATDPNGNTSEFSPCTAGGAPSPGTLQFSASSISKFENGGSFNVIVNRTNGSTGIVTVKYATADGTATAPLDYTTTSGTLIFNDGETSKSINVPINDNNVPEGTHNFTISLSNPTGGAALGNIKTAQLSIQDNEDPTVSIDDVSQAEGNNGTTAFTFTLTSSNAITNDVFVNYLTADGTAVAGSDYQTTSGLAKIPAGQKTASVAVFVQGNTTSEADKTFFINLSNPNNGVIGKGKGTGTILNDDGVLPAKLQFSQASYQVSEDLSAITLTVMRSGDTSGAAAVDYKTVDGSATQKADLEYAAGTVSFAPGETSKTVTVLLNEDAYVEANESFNVSLSNPVGATLDQQDNAVVTIMDDLPETALSPIDDAQSFVAMHYHDFLNREPDAAGLAFWTNQITACGNDVACVDAQRVNVSASFFLSIEYQETAYLLYLMQKESYATMPKYASFMRDLQEVSRGVVVNSPGWQQKLSDNQQQFADKWVTRPEFKAVYDALSNDAYVNALYQNAGIVPPQPEKDKLVTALNNSSLNRSSVLLRVAGDATFRQQEQNGAFVLMEYFGYLRRVPDAAPDSDLSGYSFWLNKLNQFGGNYIDAEMIKAFITSVEYRARFGQ